MPTSRGEQIDLRYRRDRSSPGAPGNGRHRRVLRRRRRRPAARRGAAFLAEALRAGGTPVWVDDNVALSSAANLGAYALVYLVGLKAHQP